MTFGVLTDQDSSPGLQRQARDCHQGREVSEISLWGHRRFRRQSPGDYVVASLVAEASLRVLGEAHHRQS